MVDLFGEDLEEREGHRSKKSEDKLREGKPGFMFMEGQFTIVFETTSEPQFDSND